VTVAALATIVYDVVQTPIDRLVVASDGSAIVGVWMANAEPEDARWADRRGTDSLLDEARRQLVAYFARRLRAFDVPLAPNGTDFQRRVWNALREIPFGTTISYAALARRVSNAAAVRAVGAANGRNPIPIIVPCHRVIGSDGSLTGFGGGLPRKQWLLRHEGAQGEFAI
jgi:methylated-DNA-[protein]-cysteine S-methyltransferase